MTLNLSLSEFVGDSVIEIYSFALAKPNILTKSEVCPCVQRMRVFPAFE